jgi:hypothetical protein
MYTYVRGVLGSRITAADRARRAQHERGVVVASSCGGARARRAAAHLLDCGLVCGSQPSGALLLRLTPSKRKCMPKTSQEFRNAAIAKQCDLLCRQPAGTAAAAVMVGRAARRGAAYRRLFLMVTSAPAPISAAITSALPSSAARCSGVSDLLLSRMFTDALALMSAAVAAAWPLAAAVCSGVFLRETAALAHPAEPAAPHQKAHPSAFSMATSAPALMSAAVAAALP